MSSSPGKLILAIFLMLSPLAKAQEIVSKNDTCNMIDSYLEKMEKENSFSGGLLIIQNNQTIFKKGYGFSNQEKKTGFSSSTLASMGSITKSFTAVAILKLYQQNKLKLSDKLSKFFKDVPSDKANITIHQLLTHSSGFTEFLEEDKGDYEKIETEEFLKRAFKQPLTFDPGSKAVYTNVGMSILGIIIEKTSGQDYETFLQKEIFDRVGIKSIGYHYPVTSEKDIAHGYQNGKDWGTHQTHFENTGGGPYWNLKANGGLEASLNDMELWIKAITGFKILPDSLTKLMFFPHIIEDGTQGFYSFGYGCNISSSRRNTQLIDNGGSNGIYFARLIRLPEENVCFYMVTNESSMNANMILPNVTQLYFYGKIIDDMMQNKAGFEFPAAKDIYELISMEGAMDLESKMKKAGITVQNDMALLEVGQKLTAENKIDEAIEVYIYYTKTFPSIIVAQNDLGDLYLQKGKKDKAVECYKNALKINPDNQRAKSSLKDLE